MAQYPKDRHIRQRLANDSLLLATTLSPVIGYDNKGSAIAHKAQGTGTSLRDAAIASGATSAAKFDKIVVP